MAGETGSNEVLNFISGQILSGPEDSIFDDIFDWIANSTRSVVQAVAEVLNDSLSSIYDYLSSWLSWLWDVIKGPLDNLLLWLKDVFDLAYAIESKLSQFVSSAWFTVSSAVNASLASVYTWIKTAESAITSWVSREVNSLLQQFASTAATIGTLISDSAASLLSSVFSQVNSLTATLFKAFQTSMINIQSVITSLGTKLDSYQDWLSKAIEDRIVKPLGSWWGQFLDRILDFPSWIGKFFDAVGSWLMVDLPGHSPRWTSILDTIFHWYFGFIYDFSKWFWADAPERFAYGLGKSF